MIVAAALVAMSVAAAPGDTRAIGHPNSWIGAIAGVALEGELFAIENSGEIFAADPADGRMRIVARSGYGLTALAFPLGVGIVTIEGNGTLFAVDAKSGQSEPVGDLGLWKGTVSAAAIKNRIYAVDDKGSLWSSDITEGTRARLGKGTVPGARFLVVVGEQLVVVDADGMATTVATKGGALTKVAGPGVGKGTVACAALGGKVYTVDNAGQHKVLDLATGAVTGLGKPGPKDVTFLVPVGAKLYELTKTGTLLEVSL